MIDPNDYFSNGMKGGVFEGQTRNIMFTKGDWVLYNRILPVQGYAQAAYIIHDCQSLGKEARNQSMSIVGVIGTDVNQSIVHSVNRNYEQCPSCGEKTPTEVQTLYRIYAWGIEQGE
jgi:hypothetical protein